MAEPRSPPCAPWEGIPTAADAAAGGRAAGGQQWSLPCTFLLPAPSAPRVHICSRARWQAGRHPGPGRTGGCSGLGAVSSLSPPLSPPGLHVLAIAFALEVSVGKTNTVMALNNSDVLLPCTFTTCIGFQDLVFTWYFNSTEMVGGSLGFASVFSAGPFVLPQCRAALQFSQSSLLPLARCPSLRVPPAPGARGRANRATETPGHVCALGTKLFWVFCCPWARFFSYIGCSGASLHFGQNRVNFLLQRLL